MNKQQGSVHVAIGALLVVALLGALGFIFWQNFAHNDSKVKNEGNSKTGIEKQDNQIKFLTGKLGEPFGLDMEFQYPETWKLQRTVEGSNPANNENITTEEVTLSSPGKYSVNFKITSGGLGGTCIDSENGKVQSIEYENLESLRDVVFVKSVTTDQNGTFMASARLYKTTDYFQPSEIKAGDTACKLYLGFPNYATDRSSTINFIETDIVNSESPQGTYSVLDEAKKSFSGKYYDEAMSILLSLKTK